MHVNLKEEPKIENNFKLICGQGDVISKQPIMDDFFSLKIRNTLRLRRTVYVYERRLNKGLEKDDYCFCRRNRKGIELNEVNSHLGWVKVTDEHPNVPLKSKIFHADETYIASN